MAEMQPTMEILERIKKNSKENKDEVFTRLYRYMLRPDLYYIAYKNLYANNGAATEGVNNDTADGFSEEKIIKIIDSLRNESYQPKPSRRTYRKKANGKMRPLLFIGCCQFVPECGEKHRALLAKTSAKWYNDRK